MLNRFIYYISLIKYYGQANKTSTPALTKSLALKNKIADINQQESLKIETKSIKLHNDNIQKTDLVDDIVSEIDSVKEMELAANESAPVNQSEKINNDYEKNQTAKPYTDAASTKYKQENNHGLLSYRKWWELNEVELLVNGNLINGTPIFIEEDTLRVINNTHSYFIPLEKIDYIRTDDGLQSSFKLKIETKN